MTLDLLVLSLVSFSSPLVLRVRAGREPSYRAPLLGEKFPCICLLLILAQSITDFSPEVSPAAMQEPRPLGKLSPGAGGWGR